VVQARPSLTLPPPARRPPPFPRMPSPQVKDLCSASQTSREWRAAAGAADSAWQRAFEADFGPEKAADYGNLRTWRDKYM